MKLRNYPENITKLETLTICSNKIIGGGDLIRLGSYVPLIIGDGVTPRIWINIKIGDTVAELVKDNHSLNNEIKMDLNTNERKIKISANNNTIISARMVKDKECIVDKLDLRPIGLNIFGSTEILNINSVELVNNTFEGLAFLAGAS